MAADAHAVGLRDLRHHTSEVLARVRHGETIDVTEHGRLIARIVPVEERQPTPVLARLVASGRAALARAPVTGHECAPEMAQTGFLKHSRRCATRNAGEPLLRGYLGGDQAPGRGKPLQGFRGLL